MEYIIGSIIGVAIGLLIAYPFLKFFLFKYLDGKFKEGER